ncbi:hypothetical protein BSLG_009838 [Batrachochytrium salamandrivorans]|nr:hypothetical protein BSLG_009838 [Batrachochytrium salamandrivorans]
MLVCTDLLPTSSTSLSMGDLSGVSSGNTLPGILSNSSTGLSAISVSNSGLSASVSQVLPMPAMYGPLQPQTHVYYYAQLPHQSTTPPLLGSVLQPSVALDKSGTANSQATNGSGGNTNLNAQSALLPGNHQRQRQLNLHRQRPASMVGMLQTGTATLSPSQQPHLQPSGQAMRRSSSFVTSLRNLAGLMVGSYGANNPDTAVAADFGGGGMASILLCGSTDSNIGNRSGSPLMHSTSTVPPSHRDANGPVYSGVNRVHPRSSMPIFARMGSSDGRSGDSGTGSRGTVGFNDGAGSALATQFLSRGEDLDDACANPNKVAFNSAFYEWSCAYFSEPQMRVPDVDDPGSIKFIERQWRRERNNKVIQETDALYTYSLKGVFEYQWLGASFDRSETLSFVIMTDFIFVVGGLMPLVVSADDQVISIYDWEESTKVNTFSNDNPKGSRITSLQFINEDDATLLLTGSDDGLVRLYRNFNHQNVELVAAWRALSDILPGSRGSGLHCRWQQSSGYLFVGGDSRIIKVWDAEEELCIQELPTKSTSQVTGLSVDPTGIMMLAGFMDGNVKLYDRRLPPHECVVANFAEPTSRVLQVAYVGYQHQEFLMGTASGDVLLWDIRQRARTLKINVGIPDVQITAFSIHEHGLLVGCGSNTQNVRVMNLMGETIGAVRYNEGFLQRQTLPVHSLAFHPRRMYALVSVEFITLFSGVVGH